MQSLGSQSMIATPTVVTSDAYAGLLPIGRDSNTSRESTHAIAPAAF